MILKGKTAVVTGGTRGIGRAIVELFAKEGAKVVFTYQNSNAQAWEIEQTYRNAKGFKVDVRETQQIERWKEMVIEKFGPADILVNNAGIIRDKALAMMSREDWDDVINTNLNGVFNVTKAFIVSFMKQKAGTIINISSLSGIMGIPRQTNYSASKGALNAFSRSLAKEVAVYNIRVNVVAPGFIDTDMTKTLRDEHVQQIMPQIPLGRFGSSEEVAKVVLFLATDESQYITGQVLRVDGGLGM